MNLIDTKYLIDFDEPMVFDESTVRKKLKEYCEIGIVNMEKVGRTVHYSRALSPDVSGLVDAVHYFSEACPCGVIGSFILDKTEDDTHPFEFKHHYITDTLDSNVLALLFDAMRRKCAVTVSNMSRRRDEPRKATLVPLRIFISTQSGRHHLIAYQPEFNSIRTFRVDYLSGVKIEGEEPRFDEFRAMLDDMQKHMWGVNIKRKQGENQLEHVEFVIRIESGEDYIVKRLEREKRVGRVEKIDEFTYKFSADVYDTMELHTWIRTFICRIVQLDFSNRTAENRFREDIEAMYRIYGLSGGEDE
jgi:predicted DNA-binding transcriptional regulator YafY